MATVMVKIPKDDWILLADYDCYFQSTDQNIYVTEAASIPTVNPPEQAAKIAASNKIYEFISIGGKLYGFTLEGANVAIDPKA